MTQYEQDIRESLNGELLVSASDKSSLELVEMPNGWLLVRHLVRVPTKDEHTVRLPGVFKRVAARAEAKRISEQTGEPVMFAGRRIF